MGMNFNEVWTGDRIERLKILWASGMSCSQVAAALGCFGHCMDGGRSAVIGKISRLKLPKPDVKITRAISNSGVAKRPSAPRPGKIASLSRSFGAPAPRTPPNSIAAKLAIAEAEPGLPESLKGEAPDGTGVKFIDLKIGQCKWPRGEVGAEDFEFCGCKALPDLPYCAPHTRRAIQPAQARVRVDKRLGV